MDMIKVTELPEGRRERKSQYISSVDSISLPEGGAPASNIRRALLSANAAASAQNGDASNTCISAVLLLQMMNPIQWMIPMHIQRMTLK
jgi:hypothetical protein